MLANPHAPPVTRHDYAAIPEGSPRYELVEGDLVMAPSPSSFHQDIVGNLYFILRGYLREHPLGRVCIAPLDTYLSEINVFQPDLLYIRKENLGIIEEHGVEGAPDLVVEVLSKTSARFDLGPKRATYRRTGVEQLWIIDPKKRTLAVFELATDAETPVATYGIKQSFESPLFPGLVIRLAEVFAR